MANVLICDGYNVNASIPPPHKDKMVIASYEVRTNNNRANFGNVTCNHYCGECFRTMINVWTTGGFPNEETVSIERTKP